MTATENKKRMVLIVSFWFPPTSGMGPLRVGKFAKYLPQFGWEPLVLTVDRVKGYPQTSPVEIDEANIFRTPHLDLIPSLRKRLVGDENFSPQGIHKRSAFREAALKVIRLMKPIYTRPELEALFSDCGIWYPYAIRKGLELIATHKVDAIFSSSPPPILNLISSYLARRKGIPWVADFRDQWSLNLFRKKIQPFRLLEMRQERRVVDRARLLVTVSEPLARELEAFHSKKVVVIPNGFDEVDYAETTPLLSKFTVTFTGMTYPENRPPDLLFEAVKQLHEGGGVSASDLEFRFFGINAKDFLTPFVDRYHLGDLMKIYGVVPLKESIQKQKESAVLFLIANDPRDIGSQTGKIFEYLAAGRPVIALALKGGTIDKLLQETGCGIVTNEVDEIKNVLARWLEEFRQYGKITSYYDPKPEVIKNYTRREETRKLAEVLEQAGELSV